MVIARQSLGNADSCNFQAQRKPEVAVWRRAVAIGVGLIAASATPVAGAADEARFQATLFGSYASGDDFEDAAGEKRETDDGGGWGLALDWQEATSWNYYELIYASFSSDIDAEPSSIDLDIDYLQLGGTVTLGEDPKRFFPYFGMTIGAARFSPDQNGLDNATKFAFTVGAGVRIPINERIGVRAEWRSYVTVLGSDSDLFCASNNGAATCALRSKGDLFLQHSAQLGVTVGF